MVEYHIGWLALVLVVLTASNWSYVRRYTGIDDDVLLASMLVHGKSSQDFETMAMVQLIRNCPQPTMQIR